MEKMQMPESNKPLSDLPLNRGHLTVEMYGTPITVYYHYWGDDKGTWVEDAIELGIDKYEMPEFLQSWSINERKPGYSYDDLMTKVDAAIMGREEEDSNE